MARQKSEDRVVLEGGVTPAEHADGGGQGKAVPVEEAAVQLCLPIATAEVPEHGSPGAIGVPKAVVNAQPGPSVTMEEVASRLTPALLKVLPNKGAPGPDGATVEQLRERWPMVLPGLHRDLLAGRWRPGEIRRALIPKADGGQRGLGIPNVVDRVVM